MKFSYSKKGHFVENCTDFLNHSVNERVEHRASKLCLSYMKTNHLRKNCNPSSCRILW